MTLLYDSWLTRRHPFSARAATRAADTWAHIQELPSEVTLYRGDTSLGAQTIRIEFSNFSLENLGGSSVGDINLRFATLFGVRDHPTVPDTDIQKGDLFVHEGTHYEIENTILKPGEIQARAIGSY